MNGRGINISVSGGNANFGNVVQGDASHITAGPQTINAEVEAAFSEMDREIEARALQASTERKEVEALRAELAALKNSVATRKSGSWDSIVSSAKGIYEKYGWAADPLKKLFKILVPTLIL